MSGQYLREHGIWANDQDANRNGKASESILDCSSTAPKHVLHATHDVQSNVMHVYFPMAQLHSMRQIMIEAGVGEAGLPPRPEGDGEIVAIIDRATGATLNEELRQP